MSLLAKAGKVDFKIYALNLVPDTTSIKVDTSVVDSTARVKFFNRKKVYKPYIELSFKKPHPFMMESPYLVTQEVKIDSTGKFVKISEKIAGYEQKFPLVLPLEKYIQIKLAEARKKSWVELAHQYEVKEKKDDIERLFGSITNIQIPVPANPILSIFGPPVINLHISGAVDITGAWRNEKTEQILISRLGSVRNEPDFNQQVQINVGGTIGDKLNITADWNTQRQFEYENQLKIRYKGYDDEIVQSIEAGNVSLQTPSSLIGSSQALFGIKANFQMGPLKLTTIASQKKGESQERVITGGTQSQDVKVYLYQYSQSHFFIDEKYIPTYEPYFQNSPPVIVSPGLRVKDIEVWVSQLERPEPGLTRSAVADINLPPATNLAYYDSLRRNVLQSEPGKIEVGLFRKLEKGKDYTINEDIGVISLNTNIQDNQAIAVAYRVEGPTAIADDDTVYGDFVNALGDTTARLVLKLVKPKSLQPTFKKAWELQLRNIYPIGGARNIKDKDFDFRILYRERPDQEPREDIDGINLLQAFGFDKFKADGTPGSDNKFDFIGGITINPARGEVIFPYLKPFSKETLKKIFQGKGDDFINSIAYDDLYDTNQVAARNNTAKASKFELSAKVTSDVSATFNLGFNVAEGSVQVFLNDRQLKEGVDYRVDYILGQVTIINRDALLPGSNVRIKYETNDLFSFASKTILGARGDLDLGENTKFGFTLMNYAQQSLSDKVRLGEEPISNTMMGVDFSTKFNSRRFADLFNILPNYQAKQEATFNLRGESAFIFADPNTRKSTIQGDNGESIVYIDDFEGSKRTISLGLTASHWHFASPPALMPFLGETRKEEIPDSVKVQRKAFLAWFNLPQSVQVNEIWPQKKVAQEAQFITPLDVRFLPQKRGQYNYTSKWDSLKNTPRQNWAGFMRILPYFSTDLTRENITYIEVWLKVEGNPGPYAKMLIDLGQISEDVIPNRVRDTEDKNGNFRLDPDEDVGLDGMNDAEEKAKYPYLGDDPSQDNFNYSDLLARSGTEGNRNYYPEPDDEDLNRNYVLDLVNNYFEYEIPLDSLKQIALGGGSNGWYQIKIPLSNYTRAVGTPNLTLVEFVRVWFSGFENEAVVRIAQFDLVGNYWEEAVKDDDKFKITVVSVEDNPEYTPPPGVQRPRDRTRPDQDIQGNEQSLAFIIRGLPDDTTRFAQRRFPQRLDLFNYKIMRLFVHGSSEFYVKDTTDYAGEIFIWIGTDTSNFYEYRQPIWSGWDPRNNIEIVFDQLTALKQTRDSANQPVKRIPVPGGPPGATYWLKGNPSLTNITFIAIGVTNPSGKGVPLLSGDVWVNELRLLKANDATGWAYNLSAQISVPELLNLNFGLFKKSPEFRGLADKFVPSGGRNLTTNWSFSANLNIEKILPEFIGSSIKIPFTYTRAENIAKPKYIPGKDVLAEEAAQRLRQTILERGGTESEANTKADSLRTSIQQVMISESFAIPSLTFAFNSRKWYVQDVINKVNLGVNFNRSRSRDINTESNSRWGFNFQMNYSTAIKPITFKPFASLFDGLPLLNAYKNWEIQFTPSNFSGSIRFDRSQENRKLRFKTVYEPTTRIFNAQRGFSFDWKFTNNGLINPSLRYSVDIGSNLAHLETDSLGRQRSTSEILGDMFFKDGFINFGKTAGLSQQVTLGTNPKIPPILNIDKYLSVNFSYSSAYRWENNFQQAGLGRRAGYNTNLNLSFSLRLKSLADSWFGTQQTPKGRGREAQQDTSQKEERIKLGLKDIFRILIKTPFLDYESVQLTFTQNSTAQNTGLYSERPGMGNFWARIPFVQSSKPEYGPSLLYQLGLVSDPNGEIKFASKKKFPFFGFEQTPGLRAPNGNLTDIYNQSNRISITTSRPLWQGAFLDLSWNINWSFGRQQSIITDALGNPRVVSLTTTGSIGRSFFTLPPLFIFSIFKSGIKEVASKYTELKFDPRDKRTDDEKLAQAFEEGFETLPILSKIFGGFLPRLNWRLRWDGLEKLSIFQSFAMRVGLEHSYSSNFEKRWRSVGQGINFESERINYDFNPLIGLNITFKPLWNGNLTGGFRYITSTSYDLTFSSKAIVETFRREISFNLNYSKRGFNIPLFGLSLKNDVDVNISYSSSSNSRKTYQARNLSEAIPLDGILRTVLEFRFRYVLSTRVTGSLFYRMTKSRSDSRSTFIPGSTINEVGVDLHISIGA